MTANSRTTGLVRGVAVVGGTIAFMVGIPWALVQLVGNPFPTVIPSVDDVRFAITNGQVDQWTFIKGAALVTWAAWTHLAASFTVEIAAAMRGGTAAAVRGLGATQWFAARVVAQVSLVFTLLFQSTIGIAGASTLPPVPTLAATAAPIDAAQIESPSATTPGDKTRSEAAGGEVAVTRRDTLWALAEMHLGDGQQWKQIRDANVGRTMSDGTVLPEGFTTLKARWTLIIPGLITPTDESPESDNHADRDLETGRDTATGEWILGSWRVEPGDHFWKISETVLEEAWGRTAANAEIHRYWNAVVEANREHLVSPSEDPNLIYPDQQFEVLLPPLPADIGSADDAATSTPFSIDQLDQFTPQFTGPDTTATATPPPQPVDEAGSVADPGVRSAPAPTTTAEADSVAEPSTEAEAEPTPEATSVSGSGIDVKTISLGLLGTAVGAGALMSLLRRRRQLQAARRRPETVIEETPILPSELEERIRPIGDTETVRWLNATNHFLTHRLSLQPEAKLPPVIAMRAGAHGVELLLDEPCTPIDGFINGGAGGKAWRLHPDLEPRELEAEASHAQPYSPALVPVGKTDAGDLLLDFEQIGSIALSGDTDTIIGWLRSIAVGVTSVFWSQHCEVVAIGVDNALDGIAQVTVPENPEVWAQEAVRRHEATADRLHASPYEQRVNPGEIHWPEIVLVGPGFEGIAQHLSAAADLAFSPLAVVAAAPLRSETRIEMQPDHATIEPLALSFMPAVTTSEAVELVVSALAATEQTITIPDAILNGTQPQRIPGPADDADPSEAAEVTAGENAPDTADQTSVADVADATEANAAAEGSLEPQQPPTPSAVTCQDDSVEEPETPNSEVVIRSSEAETPMSPCGPQSGATGHGLAAPIVAASSALSETEEAIQHIEEVRPVEVKVLVAVPRIDGLTTTPQPKTAAIISYLAFFRTVSADRIRTVFWPKSVSRSTSDNAVTEIRRLLGTNDDGTSRLPLDRNSGRFELSAQVGSDWARVEQLVDLEKTRSTDAERMACLRTALQHVSGRPCQEASMKHYRWFLDDHEVYTRVETVLVDAAYRLGELAYKAGESELARWSADKGLLIVPGQEALHRIQMKAASLAGDEQGVEDAYRAATRSAEALSAWEDVQPETDELYAMLTRRSVGDSQAPT